MNVKLSIVIIAIVTILVAVACLIHQPEETAGSFIQGPVRVVTYQNYFMFHVNASSNTSLLTEMNGTSTGTWSNTTFSRYMDYPRNVVLYENTSSLDVGAAYANVEGYDITGDLRTENISINFTSAYGNGSIPFFNVTNITWTNVSATKTVSAGFGDKFGLPNLIKRTSDVLAVSIADAGVGIHSQTVNVSYNTIDFSRDPNNAVNYQVWYRGYGVIPP